MSTEFVFRSTIQARKRAIIKTLGYRFFMLLITVVVAWLFIGSLSEAVNIGLVANVLKTGTYYLYERTWDRVTWGITTPD